MAFLGAFHGRTYGAMSLSGSKPIQRRGFAPLVPEIHHARYGDLESVHALLRTVCPPDELAAIFVEPIQGEGGYIVPPAELPARACGSSATSTASCSCSTRSRAGIGRTGKMFASEHWGVARDIVCLAKGIANGLPLGAIVARGRRDGLAQRQPRLHLRRQPRRLRRGARDAAPGRDALPRQRRPPRAAAPRRPRGRRVAPAADPTRSAGWA